MEYVLGADLGTSSIKGAVFNQYGKLIDSHSIAYPIINIKSGYNEQNPDLWYQSMLKLFDYFIDSIPDFNSGLKGISFSGQMHSLVLVDHSMEVIRNAILWNDVRTSEETNYLNREHKDLLLSETKNIAREGFTLPKILWVQKNEPKSWLKTYKILLPKDYLRFKLTGKINMDMSDAAGTLLLDVESKKWSKKILNTFNISKELLPDLVEATDFVGYLSEDIRKNYKFENQVKVFAGGADNACAAVGSGILTDKIGLASIGTSGVFLSLAKDAKNEKGLLHLFNHAIPNKYYNMGVTLSAGNSLTWFKNTFGPEKSYDEILKDIDLINPGSNGLLFAPYLNGERTPYSDSNIRGSYLGIDSTHTFAHFARSTIEGITFSLRDSKELIESEHSSTIDKVVSIGGGSKNKDWLQIQADIFNAEVRTVNEDQGPSTGAAMIAALGIGWYKNYQECLDEFIKYDEIYYPVPENVMIYDEIYSSYKLIYDETKEISYQLTKFNY